jgi:hypothetical protein
MAGKNVAAPTEDQDLALFGNERPDWVTETARGSEEVSTNDLSLPRLSIIQDLSPQRKKDKDEYIEGASEGMIFNTVTGELFTKGVFVVPCFMRPEHTVWKDRKSGGGFGGAFETEAEAEAFVNAQEQPELWDINYTHQHFCVMVMPGHTPENPKLQDVVISMSRSQLKPSRKWNTTIQQLGGDRFARAYRLDVIQDRSEKGEFYNWSAKPIGFAPKDVYDRAESVYEAVRTGTRDVNRTDDRGTVERADPNDM